jgi:acyl-CoA synthetase (AMP-forming)/AMP-acid ligase II
MRIDWAALTPPELVVLLVAGGGLAIVALFSRRLSRWFALAYGCLLVGAVATNAEHLLMPRTLNLVEHAVGNMGAGLATAVAAYVYRQHNVVGPEQATDDPAGTDVDPAATDVDPVPTDADPAGTDVDAAANQGVREP